MNFFGGVLDFFKKRVDFGTTSYLCGVDVAIHFCGKKYFPIFKKFNLVYTTSKKIWGPLQSPPDEKDKLHNVNTRVWCLQSTITRREPLHSFSEMEKV